MISHVWSSGEALTLDPATGVQGDRITTSRYNDFSNLRWLGNKPATRFQLHSTEEAGRWVCVEARAKLNTPGRKDGLNQLWIDGRLEADRKNLDWRGTYTRHGINAVFLETYWNDGSPVAQSRWIDNFVISTKPIGPIVCSRTPLLFRTPYRGPGELAMWQVEVATVSDSGNGPVVWQSHQLTASEQVRVDAKNGTFVGPLEREGQLRAGQLYSFRVRQRASKGPVSPWSSWHQVVKSGE